MSGDREQLEGGLLEPEDEKIEQGEGNIQDALVDAWQSGREVTVTIVKDGVETILTAQVKGSKETTLFVDNDFFLVTAGETIPVNLHDITRVE